MRYTLRQLQVFVTTAEQQNITRAAQQLAMSQSAASEALRELERQFDLQLFDRRGKKLLLNAHGYALRPKAQALLDQASELELALSAKPSSGRLRIGATLTIGNYLAVDMIAAFRQQQPDSQLELSVANTHDIVEQVLHAEIDMGLIEGDRNHRDLAIQPWRRDELVVFCAPSHPLAQKQYCDLDTLCQADWILREPGSGTRQTFERALHQRLPELNIAMQLQHTEAIKRAVEANLGISCLSRIALKPAFARGTLIELATPELDLQRQLYLIQHRKKYQSELFKRWLDFCREPAQLD